MQKALHSLSPLRLIIFRFGTSINPSIHLTIQLEAYNPWSLSLIDMFRAIKGDLTITISLVPILDFVYIFQVSFLSGNTN